MTSDTIPTMQSHSFPLPSLVTITNIDLEREWRTRRRESTETTDALSPMRLCALIQDQDQDLRFKWKISSEEMPWITTSPGGIF